MESALSNSDVSVIWCPPLTVEAVDDVRAVPSTLESGTYGVVNFTDGLVSFTALLLPAAYRSVQKGDRLRLTRHRVQWTNHERHWFVSELEAAGPAPPRAPGAPPRAPPRALPRALPGMPVNLVTVAVARAVPEEEERPMKRAKVAAHPFLLGR